jgi:hypothetical protein
MRPANLEPLHFVGERSAPHAKFNSGTLWATDYPTNLVKRLQNHSALGIAQRNRNETLPSA